MININFIFVILMSLTIDAVLTNDIPEIEFQIMVENIGGRVLYYSKATFPATVLVRFFDKESAIQFSNWGCIKLIK